MTPMYTLLARAVFCLRMIVKEDEDITDGGMLYGTRF
jgi:hypothetical protein